MRGRGEEEDVYTPVDNFLKSNNSEPVEATLSYSKALLEAQNEAIPDGILVVNPKGKILSYNRHFVKIWQIPQEILDSKDDSAALVHACSLVVDPQEFIKKGEEVYANQGSEYRRDTITFRDGRIIERFGKAVVDSKGTNLGWAWYFRDVTEQHRNEQEIKRQKNLYLNALESIWDAFISFDFDWKIIYANQKAALIGNFIPAQILGKKIHEAFPDLIDTPLWPLFEAGMRNRKSDNLDFRIPGTSHWINVRVNPSVEGISIFASDITDHKFVEESLKKSEDQYRTFANSLPQLAWMANADGWIYWYNERWYDYTGTTLEETQGWGWEKVHHPEHIERVLDFAKTAWSSNEPFELEFPLRRGDGVYRWFLTRVFPVKDDAGNLMFWVGTNTDIHDQLEVQKALKQSEAQLKQLADFMPQIVWSTDPNGYHDFYNKRWYEFTGLTFQQSRNKGWSQVLHPDDVNRTRDIWARSLQTGDLYEVEYRMRRHDGQYRWLLARAMPLRDESGIISRWFGTCTDIHDQRLLADTLELKVTERTRDLQSANSNLQRINEELRQFNYIASHDLQEPIRKIRIFADRIKIQDYETMSEASRTFLDKIFHSSDHLSVLFKDLLEFINIQREMPFTLVDLGTIIREVELDLEQVIREKQATIRREELPTIKGIPLQIYQLFYNLIHNSLKFSASDTAPIIQIRVQELPPPEEITLGLPSDKLYHHLVVSDNGMGFEQEYADRIFVLFKRLHNKHAFKGTGVGLALCKKVVENHQGKIWAESVRDSGAVFHILLPVHQQPA